MAENVCLQNGSGKEEVIVSRGSSNIEDARFDQTIGCIQDILLDEEFNKMKRSFMERHYHHFEDTDENKFIYMDIFQQYTDEVEAYLNEALTAKLPGFLMEKFMDTLVSRKDEVGEEIMDMLLSFSDFLVFKQTFLDYKAEKEGHSVDLRGFLVNSLSSSSSGRSDR